MTVDVADLPGSVTEVAVIVIVPGSDGAWYVTAAPLAEVVGERLPHPDEGQVPSDHVTPAGTGSLKTMPVTVREPLTTSWAVDGSM